MADDDDDPQLRSLRAAWRSLPDEDPPERGLAELMAAAREQAKAMADVGTPWWKRALVAMMRPPMLALATVVVLLGGVFVVTSSHKGVSPEPSPVEDQSAPMVAPAAPPPAVAPFVPAAPSSGSAAEPTTAAAPTPEPLRALRTPPPARPTSTVHHAAPVAKRAPDSIPDPFASSHDDESRAPSAPPPPPASPAPPPAKLEDSDGAGEGGADNKPTVTRGAAQKTPVSETSTTPRQQLDDQLLTQCHAAAARGDCELAKKIAHRISNDDAAYYSAHVTTDATIAACLGK
jgi:hypothetical protein